MSIEDFNNNDGASTEQKMTFPAPVDDNAPDVIKRRGDNAPAEKEGELSQEEISQKLDAGPQNPEAREILNQQIGLIQSKFEDRTYDTATYNRALVWFYMELTERNPAWRDELADAIFSAAITANQEGDEEGAINYANQLTDNEYNDRYN